MSIKLKANKRGGEVMRSTAERRMAILEYMCERRHETLERRSVNKSPCVPNRMKTKRYLRPAK